MFTVNVFAQRDRVGYPADQLMASDEEHIRELEERVNKFDECLLSVRSASEPRCVVSHGERWFATVSVMSEYETLSSHCIYNWLKTYHS